MADDSWLTDGAVDLCAKVLSDRGKRARLGIPLCARVELFSRGREVIVRAVKKLRLESTCATDKWSSLFSPLDEDRGRVKQCMHKLGEEEMRRELFLPRGCSCNMALTN